MTAIHQKREMRKKKKGVLIPMKELEGKFMDNTGYTLADYSVALGYFKTDKDPNPIMFGSGVLVRRGDKYGILTAHHCVHPPGPDLKVGNFGGNRLGIVLKRSQPVIIQPEVIQKYALAIPNGRRMEPDLAFLEIAPSPVLSSIKAIASFWRLDSKSLRRARRVGKSGTLFTVIGFPGQYQFKIPATKTSKPRHLIKHMAYFYVIRAKSLTWKNGWDYIEATNMYDQGNDLPESFQGVSGGPIWGLVINQDKKDKKVKLKGFALIGIAFLQNKVSERKIKIRGHFIDSIYKRAWEKL
jgi:hypothetical protein